jgi:hypothetical protein
LFLFIVSVGYLTDNKANGPFLDAKVGQAWHLWYSLGAWTILQGALGFFGWSRPLRDTAASCGEQCAFFTCRLLRPYFCVSNVAFFFATAGTVFSFVPL